MSIPVTNWNTAPPTSSSRLARSTTSATDRAGGQENSLGMTDHSLARSIGTSVNPPMTCTPWVTRYNQTGSVGQSNR
ncbi:hypothetical protein ACFQYP_49350 [Nonomuraea antimicrobica]